MERHTWGRRLAAALLILSLGAGLSCLPLAPATATAAAAGRPAQGHHMPAHASARWQDLPAGLAPVLQQSLRRAGGSTVSWSQQAVLTDTDGAAFDNFGLAVALSGNTALVGVYAENANAGAAYIFVRSGTTWSQVQELTPRDAASGDQFGQSVALSGTTALIGAPYKNGQIGAAYVFTRNGATWGQQAKLIATDGASFDFFGQAVALGADTALIGAPGHNGLMGATYVFARFGSSWVRLQELIAADSATSDQFGYALSVNGATALIGAPYKNSQTGEAYVFVRNGLLWKQQATLSGSGAANGAFGFAVAVNGATALVGAYGENSQAGVVYVFVRNGSAWGQQTTLTASDGARGDLFGQALSLGPAGAVVGAPGQNRSTGAVYVFVRSAGVWSQQAKLTAAGAAHGDIFGVSVALSGASLLIGAPGTHGFSGAAYVFVRTGVDDL